MPLVVGLIQNAMRQQDGQHSKQFDETKNEVPVTILHTDTTFNFTHEGWCHATISCRNSRRVRGKMTGEAMPICYLLSRTENGPNVANMFTDVRAFLGRFEHFHFHWNVVVSDHHDGVIKEVRDVEQGRVYENSLPTMLYCQCN